MSSMRSTAPWADWQVANLNEFQQLGFMHPFTCGDNECTQLQEGERQVLVATTDGWRCPKCCYEQDWAHGFMASGEAVKRFRESPLYATTVYAPMRSINTSGGA